MYIFIVDKNKIEWEKKYQLTLWYLLGVEVSIKLVGSNKNLDLIFIIKYFSVFQIESPVTRRGNAYQGYTPIK